MNKVLATLIAGLFAVGAFAQAPAALAAPAKVEVKAEVKKVNKVKAAKKVEMKEVAKK